MTKGKYILLATFVFSSIFSCQTKNPSVTQSNKTPVKNTLANTACLYENESVTFLNEFFPFEFTNYNTKKLLSYFDESVKVDSVETNNSGYISRVYKFSNHRSEISFFVKINDPEPYFYQFGATIKNDFLKTRNGIKIDMSRADFFKAVDKPILQCDTFTIQEGEMATFYQFIFKRDKLKTIHILQSE